MKNFVRIKQGLDISPLLYAVSKLQTSEDTMEVLRLRLPESDGATECISQPVLQELSEAIPYIFGLMSLVRGERLGTVLLTLVKPGGRILPHADMKGMDKYYDRFHIVLQSNPEVLFRAGDERVYMAAGEVWWFDHTVEHEVQNHGICNRIHLIVDIKLGVYDARA